MNQEAAAAEQEASQLGLGLAAEKETSVCWSMWIYFVCLFSLSRVFQADALEYVAQTKEQEVRSMAAGPRQMLATKSVRIALLKASYSLPLRMPVLKATENLALALLL
jgi:hypothetical protein